MNVKCEISERPIELGTPTPGMVQANSDGVVYQNRMLKAPWFSFTSSFLTIDPRSVHVHLNMPTPEFILAVVTSNDAWRQAPSFALAPEYLSMSTLKESYCPEIQQEL